MANEFTTEQWLRFNPGQWFEEPEEGSEYAQPTFDSGYLRFANVLRAVRYRTLSLPPKREWLVNYLYNTDCENYFLRALGIQFAQWEAKAIGTNVELEQEFHRLAEQWREETEHLSSITKQVMNFNYQRIIGMGPEVLPILFRELERKPSYWFWALKAITGEDPTNPEDAGNIERMTESWLEWARRRGYLNVSQSRISFHQSAERQI